MKKINLSLIYIFLLFSCVSVVFGSEITLAGKKPVNVHRSSYDSVRVRAEWKDGSIYTESQCGDITWTLENGRFFSQDKDGVIVQKWPDGSYFLKDKHNNIKCDIRNIGTFTEDQCGTEKRNGLEEKQIDHIKKNGPLFDADSLDSYILPPNLLPKSRFENSNVSSKAISQNARPNQQNVQFQTQNTGTKQNSAQIIDKKFEKPTAEHEKERDERIAQNEDIKRGVDKANRGKVDSFIEHIKYFHQTQKKNVLFLDASYVDKNTSSTIKFIGKISWLAKAITDFRPFEVIKAYMTNDSGNINFFSDCGLSLSAAECWNEIKNEKINNVDPNVAPFLRNIVCLTGDKLTQECEYVDLFFHMKKLMASEEYSFVLCVKYNDFIIQSYVVKCGDKHHTPQIAVLSSAKTDDIFKNFIDSLFNIDSLSRQITELEMETTKNWDCSKKVLEELGIDKKIIDEVEKSEKAKMEKIRSESLSEKIARWWVYLKINHPKLVAGVKAVGCAFAAICVYYLLSGIFGSSSVSSMSSGGISIVNSPHGSSISLPGIKINAGPGRSNISVGGGW